MPADKAGSVAPEPNATNQGDQSGKQEHRSAESSTAQKPERATDPLSDALGIEPEIQAQILRKEEKSESELGKRQSRKSEPDGRQAEPKGETPEGERPQGEEPVAELPEGSESEGELPEGEEPEGEEPEPRQVEGEQPTKTQKRINRLTRQKQEALDRADALAAENQKWRDWAEKIQAGQLDQQTAAPIGAGRLAYVRNEQQLETEIAKANGIIEFCDANADGVTTGEGAKQEFTPPEKIAALRREAEKVLLNAPMRRDQIRESTKWRQEFDTKAREDFPALFDKSTPEFQRAVAILKELPALAQLPGANYYLGLVVEGMKSRDAKRSATNGHRTGPKLNGDGQPRAISERAFEPRVPLAPDTPSPPSRSSGASPTKKVETALQDFLSDPDGSAESLARVFQAEDEAKPASRGRKAPVTV